MNNTDEEKAREQHKNHAKELAEMVSILENWKDPQPVREPIGQLEKLRRFSITGSSEKLKQQMLADVFAMDRVAILGQWTVIYAAPNTGKTLLTIWMLRQQIEAGIIKADNVYYVNADDHFRGMTQKLEIAEACGMGMLVPSHNAFSINDVALLMHNLAGSGEARGLIFVLDTLKKFADLMDKRASTAFGMLARQFIAAGGTLITLAHTNKHKDTDGKGVYSGTSDVVDDADCAYVVDKIGEIDMTSHKEVTVEFSNKKARGDVAPSIGYTYKRIPGQSYSGLLDSVKCLDQDEVEQSKCKIQQDTSLTNDQVIIEATCIAIKIGIDKKDALITRVRKDTGRSAAKVRVVIERRTGGDYAQGHRWTVTQGDNNAQIFEVLPP